MRRARFIGAVEANEGSRDRSSIREALWFDVRAHESSDEESLLDWRVAGLEHVPILLGVTHLLITVATVLFLADFPLALSADNPLVPSLLTLLLDGAAATVMIMRHRYNFAPHTIVRGLCLYLSASGLL